MVSGESPTPSSWAVTLRTTLRVRVVKLELDLPKAQTIPRAALHGDSVVIDLGKGVVRRIVQEQALTGGVQLDKLLERLLSSEPLDDRTGTEGDLISRSLPRDLGPVECRTLCRGR